MKRSYDAIAPVYDRLAKLFIGKALRQAQIHFLPLIPAGSSVLIVGGGTGWILDEITNLHPQGLQIDYVDISSKMIALARKRNVGNNEVNFINQSILDFATSKEYEVVITPFFFDNFKEETMQKVFAFLHQKLKSNGRWLYTDFQIKKESAYWQKAVLFIMYTFFRTVANIEASQLPDVVSQFNKHQYHLFSSKTFLHQFIITTAYIKSTADSLYLTNLFKTVVLEQ